MSEGELSSVDPCIAPGETVSFECVLSAIADIRQGRLGVGVVRKLLRQVDNALATLSGEPADVTLAAAGDADVSALCDRIEELCGPTGVSALGVSPLLASLLVALLKQILASL